MHTLFQHQAGSMTNLADDALGVLMNTLTFDQVVAAQGNGGFVQPPVPGNASRDVLRTAVLQRIDSTALSDADEYIAELARVERLLPRRRRSADGRHER